MLAQLALQRLDWLLIKNFISKLMGKGIFWLWRPTSLLTLDLMWQVLLLHTYWLKEIMNPSVKVRKNFRTSGVIFLLPISCIFRAFCTACVLLLIQFPNVTLRSEKVWLTRLISRKFWAAFSKIFISKYSASSGVKRAILYTSWMDHWLLQLPHTKEHWPCGVHTHIWAHHFLQTLSKNKYHKSFHQGLAWCEPVCIQMQATFVYIIICPDKRNLRVFELGTLFTSSSCLKHQWVRDCGVTVCPQDISARRESNPTHSTVWNTQKLQLKSRRLSKFKGLEMCSLHPLRDHWAWIIGWSDTTTTTAVQVQPWTLMW